MIATARKTLKLDRHPRVVIITQSTPLTRSVVARLHALVPLAGVVVEHQQSQSPLASKSPPGAGASWRHLVRMAGRLVRRTRLISADPAAILATRALDRYHLVVGGPAAGWPSAVPLHETNKVNGAPVVAWCHDLQPDITVLLGCSIVRRALIDVAVGATINVHPSLLPEYRGWFSEMWMVLEQRLEHAGITIHLVDEGVDTGDVLLQRSLKVDPGIDPFSLQAVGAVLVPELVAESVSMIAGGRAVPRPQDVGGGRTYRRRDMTPEILDKLRRLPSARQGTVEDHALPSPLSKPSAKTAANGQPKI